MWLAPVHPRRLSSRPTGEQPSARCAFSLPPSPMEGARWDSNNGTPTVDMIVWSDILTFGYLAIEPIGHQNHLLHDSEPGLRDSV